MSFAAIGLGSNLGNRLEYIQGAISMVGNLPATTIVSRSSIMETEPVGGPKQGWFLNGAMVIETAISPQDLMRSLLSIEKALRRERVVKNGPRTIDLDILLYDNKIIREIGLQVPHPRLAEREFVLEPLKEIAPNWVHPVLGKTIREIADSYQERQMDDFLRTTASFRKQLAARAKRMAAHLKAVKARAGGSRGKSF
ncbi:MAG: 2-amino-4-hydroxy-6-hydroxymethyldihydropteridine diphosphokinase [Planctomycetes bacterium]|nr:2-amino-4-hydroxy-6-hydroxymethyldihydropteridine diphosphokinase [Planctomycetota bacterium]